MFLVNMSIFTVSYMAYYLKKHTTLQAGPHRAFWDCHTENPHILITPKQYIDSTSWVLEVQKSLYRLKLITHKRLILRTVISGLKTGQKHRIKTSTQILRHSPTFGQSYFICQQSHR